MKKWKDKVMAIENDVQALRSEMVQMTWTATVNDAKSRRIDRVSDLLSRAVMALQDAQANLSDGL